MNTEGGLSKVEANRREQRTLKISIAGVLVIAVGRDVDPGDVMSIAVTGDARWV